MNVYQKNNKVVVSIGGSVQIYSMEAAASYVRIASEEGLDVAAALLEQHFDGTYSEEAEEMIRLFCVQEIECVDIAKGSFLNRWLIRSQKIWLESWFDRPGIRNEVLASIMHLVKIALFPITYILYTPITVYGAVAFYSRARFVDYFLNQKVLRSSSNLPQLQIVKHD